MKIKIFALSDKKLKAINNILLGLILLMNGYIVLAPFAPEATYHVKKSFFKTPRLETDKEYAGIDRSMNHLLLPSIMLDQPVFIGDDARLVNKGIWHRPKTSSPEKGSNTVLAGHRYTYAGAAVFYNLDKVQPRDKMILVWNGKIYVYQVDHVLIVPPSNKEVEAPSADKRLTVYTCTPLWNAKDRLVLDGSLRKVL